MEILKVNKEGKETCYLKCEVHNFFYAGRPPLTTGCTECWMTYYMGQRAQMKPEDMAESLDTLESAIVHLVEESEKGTWDFVPDLKVDISHEDN